MEEGKGLGCPGGHSPADPFSLLETLWGFTLYPLPAATRTHTCPALQDPGPGEEARRGGQARVLTPAPCGPGTATLSF